MVASLCLLRMGSKWETRSLLTHKLTANHWTRISTLKERLSNRVYKWVSHLPLFLSLQEENNQTSSHFEDALAPPRSFFSLAMFWSVTLKDVFCFSFLSAFVSKYFSLSMCFPTFHFQCFTFVVPFFLVQVLRQSHRVEGSGPNWIPTRSHHFALVVGQW